MIKTQSEHISLNPADNDQEQIKEIQNRFVEDSKLGQEQAEQLEEKATKLEQLISDTLKQKLNRIIFSTVGASAFFNLRNAQRTSQLPVAVDLTQLEDDFLTPDKGEGAVKTLTKLMQVYYNDKDSKLLPAEITSLIAINIDPNDRLYFIAGVSMDEVADQAEICGRALANYYKSQGVKAEFVGVPGFAVNLNTRTIPQPENFLDILEQLIILERENYPDTPLVINLTGGYKLGGVYSALIGFLYGCEIYYLHEQTRTPIGIPAISASILSKLSKLDKILTLRQYEELSDELKVFYQEAEQDYRLQRLVDIVGKLSEPSWRTAYQQRTERRKRLVQLLSEMYKLKANNDLLLSITTKPELRVSYLKTSNVLEDRIIRYQKELEEL